MAPPYAPPTVPWMTDEAAAISATEGGVPLGLSTYITYGWFAFPNAIELKFQVEPVYDSSGVLPKYYKHTFTIETVISPHNSPGSDGTGTQALDLNESQFRRALAIPGQRFYIYSKGVGQNQHVDSKEPFYVTDSPTGPLSSSPSGNTNQDPVIEATVGTGKGNDEGTLLFAVEPGYDLNFGPKPVVQILEPIGSSRVYRLVWSVEICLPICCVTYQLNPNNNTPYFCLTPSTFTSQTKFDFTLTEFNYSVSWGIGEEGYTTRSINGSAEVAGRLYQDLTYANVANNGPLSWTNIIPINRVKYLITATFPYLQGFTRDVHYDLSRDGRRLEWRITDTEIKSEVPYYQGVIKCDARATLRNTDGMGFTNWEFRISGSFTVLPGVRKWQAYLAFLTILHSRMTNLRLQNQVQILLAGGQNIAAAVAYLPMGHTYEEDIFGRTCDFDFGYKVVSSLKQVLHLTRTFQPDVVPGQSWANWRNGIPQYLKDGDGSANLSLESRRDLYGTCGVLEPSRADNQPVSRETQPTSEPYFQPICPSPEKSWMEFRNWFELYDEKSEVQHTPTYKVPATYYSDPPPDYNGNILNAFPPGATPGHINAANTLGASSSAYPTIQGLGAGKYHIRMRGYAIRLCGQIRPPSLYSVQVVGGQNLQPTQVASRVVLDKVINSYGPIRTIMSYWDILYTIPKPLNAGVNFITSLVTDAEGERYVSGFDPRSTDQLENGNAVIPL